MLEDAYAVPLLSEYRGSMRNQVEIYCKNYEELMFLLTPSYGPKKGEYVVRNKN